VPASGIARIASATTGHTTSQLSTPLSRHVLPVVSHALSGAGHSVQDGFLETEAADRLATSLLDYLMLVPGLV
jgi:hypothetical protein